MLPASDPLACYHAPRQPAEERYPHMKPTGRFPRSKFIRTVSSVVIATVSFTATILLAQDNLDKLRQAAEKGDARAQYNLGKMYSKGEGVMQDNAEAMSWYRKAAEQGHVNAQGMLGFMYANGEGVPQDDAAAVVWFRRAAEKKVITGANVTATREGSAYAQLYLGIMYESGRGVPLNSAEAVKWFRRSADQGLADAQFNLGLMYATGRGVLKDTVLAHMWSNIAGANGIEEAREFRDKLEHDMTRTEIRRATELAHACMDSDYQDCPQ